MTRGMKVVDHKDLSQVFDILDDLNGKSYCVIFYEEPEHARMVEYHFIHTELQKGEYCIYTTHEDDISIIENTMADFGTDVEGYNRPRKLYVCRIGDPRLDPLGLLQGVENLRRSIIGESKRPFRIVSRFICNIESKEDKLANMFVEGTVHSSSEKYNGFFMCPYPVSNIQSAIEGAWMQNLLRNHHTAIFIFKGDKGLAMDLP
jgi:hypothetical protein